jgi:predicted amidophosphoribosyltransferase
MAQQSAQSIAGYTWQQKQTFDVAGKALEGNTEFGMLGAMMMAGGGLFGGGNGGMASVAMTPVTSSAGMEVKSSGQITAGNISRMVFCSKCAKKYPSTSKFCPYCGDVYNPCPNCGADNDEKATRCVSCGKVLIQTQGAICPKCSHPLAEGASFCANCGASAQKECPRCHSSVKADAMFCPSCGKKL